MYEGLGLLAQDLRRRWEWAGFFHAAMSVIEMKWSIRAIASNNTAVIRLDRERLNPGYLCAYLNMEEGKSELSSRGAGANQLILNIRELKTIRVPFYPLPDQEKIARSYEKANTWFAEESKQLLEEYSQQVKAIHEQIMGALPLTLTP